MSFFLAFEPLVIITALGYIGLFAIVFAESGLFFGFIFPGDSLLFTAGVLASQGILSIWVLAAILPLAAILGDSAGYWFGALVGKKLFTRDDSLLFHKAHVKRAAAFYQTYGARAIILARFVPLVRTFVPIVAGVGRMPYRAFLMFNIIGAVLWGAGVTLCGYFLGRVFPDTQHYLTYFVLFIIVLSVIPVMREWYKYYQAKTKEVGPGEGVSEPEHPAER